MGTESSRRDVLNDYAKKLIRFKARQLIQRAGFSQTDQADVEQDMTLHLLSKAELYDPSRASINTFMTRVVDSAAGMILRHRRRLKRAAGFTAPSLDSTTWTSEGEAAPVRERITDDHVRRRTGARSRDAADDHEQAEAVEHALQRMPENLRDLCRRLMNGTVTSVARDLGASRRQVHSRIARARKYFEDAGFGNS